MGKKLTGGIKKKRLACSIARACMGTSLFITPMISVYAQSTAEIESNNPNREEILVTGDKGGFTRNNSSIGKFTESLRDTPQSITSLSSEFLDQRGVVSLEEALRTVPGITMGAGEFSWQGNNPSLRGFSSRNDMFLDGIRDFGSYSRDPFNLETVEVLQGPSSMVFGRGSTGGVINQASKKPLLEPMTTIKFNLGTDSTLRGAADISRPVNVMGDGTAFRLNLMGHKSEVADPELYETGSR
jgi:catecholate siderophore receptor